MSTSVLALPYDQMRRFQKSVESKPVRGHYNKRHDAEPATAFNSSPSGVPQKGQNPLSRCNFPGKQCNLSQHTYLNICHTA